jgi:hypothetical protein
MSIPKSIQSKIEGFLSQKVEADGSGWAPVGDNDLGSMMDIFHAILEAKYAADADGDRPIDITLVDRTRYQSDYFAPLPHIRDERQNDLLVHQARMRAAVGNLGVAQQQVYMASRLLEMGVIDPMKESRPVVVGKQVFEKASAAGHKFLRTTALDAFKAYAAENPPVTSSHEACKKWEETASQALSKTLSVPVNARAIRRVRAPETMLLILDLLSIHDPREKGVGSVTFDMPTPTPDASAATNSQRPRA